jgi:hypothetical protein
MVKQMMRMRMVLVALVSPPWQSQFSSALGCGNHPHPHPRPFLFALYLKTHSSSSLETMTFSKSRFSCAEGQYAPTVRIAQFFARWSLFPHNLQHPPSGYSPLVLFGHEPDKCPLPEHTKHDANGVGFSGSTFFLHRDKECRSEPHLTQCRFPCHERE